MAKKLMIVGGHLAPALAVIEELKRNSNWTVYWIGREFAMEGKKVPSLEYEEIPRLGIAFFALDTGRLQRKWTNYTFTSALRTIPGFVQALAIVLKVRPEVILAFGGYLSVPVVVAGWLLRIPVLIHEQTTTSGLANRIAARFARKVAISFSSSAVDFPQQKVILTGNPIRQSILDAHRQPQKRPLVYITGGNQGSQTINRVVGRVLSRLLTRCSVIHQTGWPDYQLFVRKKKILDRNLARGYTVVASVAPERVGNIYKRASLVISRAGANTVIELAAVGVPAILVPIPWAERGEQEKNARLLKETGLAAIISQTKLTPHRLLVMINFMLDHSPKPSVVRAARKLVTADAARRIITTVDSFFA